MSQTLVDTRYKNRSQAAAYIGVSERKLDLMVVHDGLPRSMLGRKPIFDTHDLDVFLASRKTCSQVVNGSAVLPAALVAA